MCRVILRAPAREGSDPAPVAQAPGALGDLLADFTSPSFLGVKQESFDANSSFSDPFEGLNLQGADADLLAMFQDLAEEPMDAPKEPVPEPAEELAPVFAAQPLAPLPTALHVPLQSPALDMFQHPVALQQAGLAQKTASMDMVLRPAKPGMPAVCGVRRNRTVEEVAAQIERTKKRRRESAHRSRARRKDYISTLEQENEALRAENAALRARLQGPGGSSSEARSSSKASLSVQSHSMPDSACATASEASHQPMVVA